jgi:hypothetical protein
VRDELRVKFRNEWSAIADEGEAEIWSELAHDVAEKASDMGATYLLSWLKSTASHFIRIGAPTSIEVVEFEAALSNLYRQHVSQKPRGEPCMAGHS